MTNIDGARRSFVRPPFGEAVKDAAVSKTLFSNKSKVALSGVGKNPDAVNRQRVATSQKANEKLTQAFSANLPEIKQQKLKNKGDPAKVGKAERKLDTKTGKQSQVERAGIFFDEQPCSRKFNNACAREFIYRTTKNKYKDRAEFDKELEDQKVKPGSIPKHKEQDEFAAAAKQCRKNVCGLAILSPEFSPDRGFSSLSDLKKAFESRDYFELFAPGGSGLDVFLLPEVLDSPKISKAQAPIALAIVATLLRSDVTPDSAHDLATAMRRVSPDFHLDLSSRPSNEGLGRSQGEKLHVLTSVVRALVDSEILSTDVLESLAELEPLVEKVKIASQEAKAMSAAGNGDMKAGLAAQDHTRKASGALSSKLNEVIRDVSQTLESVVDRGLRDTDPVALSQDIMGLLHTVADGEEKRMAARSDLGKVTEMRKKQKVAQSAVQKGASAWVAAKPAGPSRRGTAPWIGQEPSTSRTIGDDAEVDRL
jgi:hypothetical protein